MIWVFYLIKPAGVIATPMPAIVHITRKTVSPEKKIYIKTGMFCMGIIPNKQTNITSAGFAFILPFYFYNFSSPKTF